MVNNRTESTCSFIHILVRINRRNHIHFCHPSRRCQTNKNISQYFPYLQHYPQELSHNNSVYFSVHNVKLLVVVLNVERMSHAKDNVMMCNIFTLFWWWCIKIRNGCYLLNGTFHVGGFTFENPHEWWITTFCFGLNSRNDDAFVFGLLFPPNIYVCNEFWWRFFDFSPRLLRFYLPKTKPAICECV